MIVETESLVWLNNSTEVEFENLHVEFSDSLMNPYTTAGSRQTANPGSARSKTGSRATFGSLTV